MSKQLKKRHKHEGEKMCANETSPNMEDNNLLHRLMRQYCAIGFKIIGVSNGLYRKGSHGIKDATDDVEALIKLADSDPDFGPALPTGAINSLVVFEMTQHKDAQGKIVVDGVAELKSALIDGGHEPTKEIMANLKTCSGNYKFHLYFRCVHEIPHTRLGVLPGVNVYGIGGMVNLVGGPAYSLGNRFMEWEFADVENVHEMQPLENPLAKLNGLPAWGRELANMESPFYAVRTGRAPLDKAIDRCIEGIHGENQARRFHDLLCQLRGHGLEKNPFFDYVESCAQASSPTLDEKWAREYAWYIWNNYRPVNDGMRVERGMKALEDSLEF